MFAPKNKGTFFAIRYKPECETKPLRPRNLVLTPEAWSLMVGINGLVNHALEQKADLAHSGVVDRSDYPDDGYGDCEDYALLKRHVLMQAGWPREAF